MYASDAGTYLAYVLLSVFGIMILGGLIVENTSLFGKNSTELEENNLEQYDRELVKSKS